MRPFVLLMTAFLGVTTTAAAQGSAAPTPEIDSFRWNWDGALRYVQPSRIDRVLLAEAIQEAATHVTAGLGGGGDAAVRAGLANGPALEIVFVSAFALPVIHDGRPIHADRLFVRIADDGAAHIYAAAPGESYARRGWVIPNAYARMVEMALRAGADPGLLGAILRGSR